MTLSSDRVRGEVRPAKLLVCGLLGLLLAAALMLLPGVAAANATRALAQASSPSSLATRPLTHTDLTSPPDLMALLALQQEWLTAPDGAVQDRFGYSVAVSGNTALVGAYNHLDTDGSEGAAYVFTRVVTTDQWIYQTELTPTPNPAPYWDYDWPVNFGCSVALSGDTALIGADLEGLGISTFGDMADVGAAYVFVGSGKNWSQQAELTASDYEANDRFGNAVALSSDGNTALIGAYWRGADSTAPLLPPGGAYVFRRSNGAWSQQGPALTASDAADGDFFGSAVAISGNTALVGAPRPTSGDIVGPGAVYVFTFDGTRWNGGSKLIAPDGANGDEFGDAVALDGPTTALVGAPNHAFTLDGQGAVYAFTFGTRWTNTAELSAPDGLADGFGSSVAVDAQTNTALIGAPTDPVHLVDQGGAYVYRRSGTAWLPQCPALTASDGTTCGDFGAAVALSGNIAAVGADEYPCGNCQGAAYVDGLTPAPSPALKASSRSVSLGKKVTLSGTVTNFLAAGKTAAIDRKVGSKLVLLKKLTISGKGTYHWTLKPNKVGKWVLLVSYKVGAQTFESKTVTVTVRK
jgi:hypothetical protein